MAQPDKDSRQRPLPPQYDVPSFRKKHRLTTEDAQNLLDAAGEDRSVADSLARIHTTSKGRPQPKSAEEKAADMTHARLDRMSGGGELGGTSFGQHPGDANTAKSDGRGEGTDADKA